MIDGLKHNFHFNKCKKIKLTNWVFFQMEYQIKPQMYAINVR